MNAKKKSDKALIAELEAENKRLRAAHADEKLGKEMYKKMIQLYSLNYKHLVKQLKL